MPPPLAGAPPGPLWVQSETDQTLPSRASGALRLGEERRAEDGRREEGKVSAYTSMQKEVGLISVDVF